jgi:hypothetical protein
MELKKTKADKYPNAETNLRVVVDDLLIEKKRILLFSRGHQNIYSKNAHLDLRTNGPKIKKTRIIYFCSLSPL